MRKRVVRSGGVVSLTVVLVLVVACTGGQDDASDDSDASDETTQGDEAAGAGEDGGSAEAGEVVGEASADDIIEGRVTAGDDQPEAGVWVLAETEDLPTLYRKIVVTNDEGEFVIPELPDAEYSVWVRGYGLTDSDGVAAARGDEVELVAQEAADEQEAAQIYPANYWLSMIEAPDDLGDHDTEHAWMSDFKLSCQLCHQVGSQITRAGGGSREFYDEGFKKAGNMDGAAEGMGREALLDTLADWSGRIQDGETPPEPPRPEEAERNLVLTQWQWGDDETYAHDQISTDKRDPTVNANGPIYAVDIGSDRLLELDPETHETTMRDTPTREGFDTPWCEQTYRPLGGSEEEEIPVGFGSLGCPTEDGEVSHDLTYDNPANPHNPMFDAEGRIWNTQQIRREWAEDMPEFCQDDPELVDNYSHRQGLSVYDPETEEWELVDLCFGTHHLQFDDEDVLWLSGDSYVMGWFDTTAYDFDDPEGTLEDAMGWSEMVVDTTGDGESDTPMPGFNYGIQPSPVNDTVWTGSPGTPGFIRYYNPEEDVHEVFSPPEPGAGPRGVDIDSDGLVWTALAGSGHLASFDRSECEQTWGEGDQCPEGWTLYETPGPEVDTEDDSRTGSDYHYYLWVDRFNTLGMGEDTIIVNGTGSDSLIAFDQENEEFTQIRVPYPNNTFTRLLDGRIDDPEAGWKGRGLWFNNGLDPIVHAEETPGYVAHVQMRPDPLEH